MTPAGPILIKISPGELLDRISILQIKLARVEDAGKRSLVRGQLDGLLRACESLAGLDGVERLRRELGRVNEAIWEAEESLRLCEHAGDFGPAFIEQARRVYLNNDRRAAIKRTIDRTFRTAPGEVKSYVAEVSRQCAEDRTRGPKWAGM